MFTVDKQIIKILSSEWSNCQILHLLCQFYFPLFTFHMFITTLHTFYHDLVHTLLSTTLCQWLSLTDRNLCYWFKGPQFVGSSPPTLWLCSRALWCVNSSAAVGILMVATQIETGTKTFSCFKLFLKWRTRNNDHCPPFCLFLYVHRQRC